MALQQRFITSRPARPPTRHLNVTVSLTSLNKESGFIESSSMNRASISIGLNSEIAAGQILNRGTAYTWTSAVVKLQWSLDKLNWFDFNSSVTFTASEQGRRGVSVTGCRYLRFVTTTAEGASDPAALSTIWLT